MNQDCSLGWTWAQLVWFSLIMHAMKMKTQNDRNLLQCDLWAQYWIKLTAWNICNAVYNYSWLSQSERLDHTLILIITHTQTSTWWVHGPRVMRGIDCESHLCPSLSKIPCCENMPVGSSHGNFEIYWKCYSLSLLGQKQKIPQAELRVPCYMVVV